MGFMEPITELFKLIKELLLLVFARQKLNQQRKLYLERCLQHTEHLGKDWLADVDGGQTQLPLDAAFVLVNLLDSQGGEVTVREVLSQQRCIVLQGPPGAGKSTLVRYITRVMARSLLIGEDATLAERRLAVKAIFPVQVELKSYEHPKKLVEMALDKTENPLTSEQLTQLTRHGAMFLLDGLDEVPPSQYRRLIEQIDLLVKNHPEFRVIVTTRSTTYRVKDLASSGFIAYQLQSLNQRQQDLLINRCFYLWSRGRLSAHEQAIPVEQQVQEFRQYVASNPALARLITIPLWLTLMASLSYTKRLKERMSKPEIYRLCIENLLHRRNIVEDTERHLRLLAEIAWRIYNSASATLTKPDLDDLIKRSDVANALSSASNSLTAEAIVNDWGVLVHRSQLRGQSEVYSFTHQGFQDFLVAYAVVQSPTDHWPVMKSRLEDPRWREIVLLYTAMKASSGSQEPLQQVLKELLPSSQTLVANERAILVGLCLSNATEEVVKKYEPVQKQLLSVICNEPSMAAQALEALTLIVPAGRDRVLDWTKQEITDRGSDLLPELFQNIGTEARQVLRMRLLEEIETCENPRGRIDVARLLAQIGDTRIGNTTPMPGSGNMAAQTIMARRAGIYPVTNAEYALFVQAQRYPAPQHWLNNNFRPAEANYPVTNVSFKDAEAYCQWLSETLGHRVYLPTDEEWTTLAAGSGSTPRFPWGNDLIVGYGNFRKDYGGPTPIGVFHEGKSAISALDVIGNVWEWTATSSKDHHFMIVRGGAWDTMALDEGIETRRLCNPLACEPNVGLRVLHEMMNDYLD